MIAAAAFFTPAARSTHLISEAGQLCRPLLYKLSGSPAAMLGLGQAISLMQMVFMLLVCDEVSLLPASWDEEACLCK